jgi:hypothetical protein
MEQQKRKDLMSSAMSDFWASDYKIGQPKINAPRPRSIEDEAFDSLWKRGNYAPQPRQIIQRPQVQYQRPMPQVQRPQPSPPQGLTQQQMYQLARERLRLQAAQARQNSIGRARTNNLIKNVFKSAVTGASSAARSGVKSIKYHTAPASEKLKREEASLKSRLKEQAAARKLETIRTADRKLSQAKMREKIYNAKQTIKTVKSAIAQSK